MRIEICIENENEEFEHEGYYDSVDAAIATLKNLKFGKITNRCNHCIHFLVSCVGAETCPSGKKYKRDPPDGGYYS